MKCLHRLSIVSQLLVNIIYSSIVLRRRQRFVLAAAAAVFNSGISVACFYVRTWLLLSDVFIVNIFHAACVRV